MSITTKQGSMEWKKKESPATKKSKVIPSVVEVLKPDYRFSIKSGPNVLSFEF